MKVLEMWNTTPTIFNDCVNELNLDYLKEIAPVVDDVIKVYHGNRDLFESCDDIEVVSLYIKASLLSDAYKWKTLVASTQLEYNPIENYNMIESETINDNKNENGTVTGNVTSGERQTVNDSENKKAPYNNNNYYANEQNTITSTEHEVTDTSNNTTHFSTENKLSRSVSRSGNIGVTTTQRLIKWERDIAQFSVIKLIAHDIVNLIAKGVLYAI